jgi:hypothetical protein
MVSRRRPVIIKVDAGVYALTYLLPLQSFAWSHQFNVVDLDAIPFAPYVTPTVLCGLEVR